MPAKKQTATRAGDLVVVHGHRLGEPARTGEILEILGEPGHPHYRVRWEDERVTIFYPSSDASIRHRTKGGSS